MNMNTAPVRLKTIGLFQFHNMLILRGPLGPGLPGWNFRRLAQFPEIFDKIIRQAIIRMEFFVTQRPKLNFSRVNIWQMIYQNIVERSNLSWWSWNYMI